MVEWLPAIVIFIYLAVVLYIGIFAFRRGTRDGRGLLPGQPFDRLNRFLPLAVRDEHDGVRHPRQLRHVLQSRASASSG